MKRFRITTLRVFHLLETVTAWKGPGSCLVGKAGARLEDWESWLQSMSAALQARSLAAAWNQHLVQPATQGIVGHCHCLPGRNNCQTHLASEPNSKPHYILVQLEAFLIKLCANFESNWTLSLIYMLVTGSHSIDHVRACVFQRWFCHVL